MSTTTANAFRDIADRSADVYKQTAAQIITISNRLESAFKTLEEREHTQMRNEMRALKMKIDELERDPLKIQLEELAEARTAQAVHEQSVKKVTTIFWHNNGEVKFKEKIGQYQPDVYIANHKVKIVADEVTTEDAGAIRDKVRRVAEYMQGLNANVGYVIIPNAGVDPETLREMKRTTSQRGLYVVRITEYAVHLQVWYDVATTGVIDMGTLVEKGHNFLQVLEPIFDEFLAIVQNLEQRDEKDFKYRQNRYKEIKFFPGTILEAIERTSKVSD
jgi:sortase (surface protein transpeptidase)